MPGGGGKFASPAKLRFGLMWAAQRAWDSMLWIEFAHIGSARVRGLKLSLSGVSRIVCNAASVRASRSLANHPPTFLSRASVLDGLKLSFEMLS